MRKSLYLILAVVIIGAGVVIFKHKNPTPTTPATTTSTFPVAPLTGIRNAASSTALTRPALTIKIENTPDALPQWGVDQADVVYEEIVNGGITRLAAIFNSVAPDKVGPVRSVRPTDTQVVWPLGGIFAYSGGAAYAVNSISTAPVKLIDESSAGNAMFRDPTRLAPHNLYARAPQLFAFKGSPTPPPMLFSYHASNAKPTGAKVSSFVVPFPSMYSVSWTWDATTLSWDRTLFGQSDITGTGVRESPKNVVVMFIDYVNGIGTENSYGNLQGSGAVSIFSGGRETTGTWSRGSSKSDVIQYKNLKGAIMTLTQGQTWVELLNTAAVLSVKK